MKRSKILLLLVLALSCTKRKEIYRANEGAPGSKLTVQVGGSSLRALQERMAQGDIKSTEALVDSLNAAQIPEEQQALQQWIEKYIDWFKDQSVGSLTSADLQEYSCLAHIQATPENRRLLESYFNILCNKIKENQYGEEPLIQALEYTLQNMDSKVFEGNPSKLNRLGDELLAKLNSNKDSFTKTTYPTDRSTLYALHQTLVLIQRIAPGQLNPNQEDGPYSRFKTKIKAVSENTQYYPIVYYALLLEQSLQRLAGPQARLQGSLRRLGQGLKGTIYLGQVARALAELNFNLDDFQKGFESLQEAFTRKGIEAEAWYDWHQAMNYASLLSLEDAGNYGVFEQGLNAIKGSKLSQKLTKEGRTALRFGIVQQLRLLALHGPTQQVRTKSIQWLEDLAQPEVWGGKPEVMEGLLDGLGEIAVQSQEEEKERAEGTLDSLIKRPEVRHRDQPLHWRNVRREKTAREAVKQWLRNCSTLEDKLKALPAPAASPASGGLFSTINSALRAAAPVESSTPAAAQEVRQALKKYYQHSDFAQVRSLFEGEALKHVDSLQCQLMLIEQVKVKEDREGQQDHLSTHHERLEWIKNPIALEDLFKSRSTKPDEPEREIHKVLLVGEPGTGKTTLSRKLAYSWTQGKWGEAFEAVYVLPVRALQ
ncbi:MAG: NACHT domain-containing protein, partial [Cytophagales bacterium]|nr:NACHT domain-containing protein [Cytophagales bacterium]